MHCRKKASTCAVIFSALTMGVAYGTVATAEPVRPEFSKLERLVEQYFYHARSRHKPILVTQSQVSALLESLRGMHIYIPGRSQIARSFPHDREFFARFVLEELARDPAPQFPEDPTFLFQRIDAMCNSRHAIRHLTRIAGQGKSFAASWIDEEPLFPSLESSQLQELLQQHGVENAAQASPRRRNYTIEHLLEALQATYEPAAESASVTTSLNAAGR